MSASVNKWWGKGNFGNDPIGKQVGDKGYVAEGSIACNEEWKDKDGNKQKHTEWINLVCWGNRGKAMEKYFKKGDCILITEGKIRTNSWEDKNGEKRYKTEVIVLDWQFPGGGKKKDDDDGDDGGRKEEW
jgi:single-strand DNA-binding protein